jgi:hypothetical protein
VQPLPSDVTTALRGYLDSKPVDALVWHGGWHETAADMLRLDLEDAGIPFRDDAGRVADFHALRHSYITLLFQSGVSPKTAQALARHSDINLTMNVYTHTGLFDLGGAVNTLPRLLQGLDRESIAATGTDGESLRPACAANEIPCNPLRLVEAPTRSESKRRKRANPLISQGVASDCEDMRATEGSGPAGIRTRNQGIMSQPAPQPNHFPGNTSDHSFSPLAPQLAPQLAPDAELQRILAAWPTLPEPIRRAMLALVETCKGKESSQ